MVVFFPTVRAGHPKACKDLQYLYTRWLSPRYHDSFQSFSIGLIYTVDNNSKSRQQIITLPERLQQCFSVFFN